MTAILNPDIIAQDLAKGGYSPTDMTVIHTETDRIYAQLTAGKTKAGEDERKFYITAGGPGAGKATLVRSLNQPGNFLGNAVHMDPDELLKLFMPYVAQIAEEGDTDDARAAAYARWRWASIYMCNTLVNRLAQDGYNIILGTTGTSQSTRFLYDAVHAAGYTSCLIMCHASEEVRLASVDKRFLEERRFTPIEDVKKKGNEMFPDAVMMHFTCAQDIALFWRAAVNEAPRQLAFFSAFTGDYQIHDSWFLEKFEQEIRKHIPGFTTVNATCAWKLARRKPAPTSATPQKSSGPR